MRPIMFELTAASAAIAMPAAAQNMPSLSESPEFRAFDLGAGHWDVRPAGRDEARGFTYARLEGNAVRRYGEVSTDEGES